MVHHFKHLFTPHHTNNHRPRILHPAGLVVLIAVFLIYQAWIQLFKFSLVASPTGFILGFASDIFPDQVVAQTNRERSAANLASLSLNQKLNEAAAGKANHMFANNYWAHIAPDGTTPWVFMQNAGYRYTVAGENLARDFGDTGSMISAWMNSPTHRENIMNPKYTQIGVAVVNGILDGAETTLVVQMFGNPTGDFPKTTPLAAATTPAPTKAPTQAPVAAAPITPSVTPQVEPTLAPTAAAIAQAPQLAALNPPTVNRETDPKLAAFETILMSPLTLTKTVGFTVILLVATVLLYDEYHTHKHKIPRKVSKNWAHLALLAVALFLLVSMTQGRVTRPEKSQEYTIMGASYDPGR